MLHTGTKSSGTPSDQDDLFVPVDDTVSTDFVLPYPPNGAPKSASSIAGSSRPKGYGSGKPAWYSKETSATTAKKSAVAKNAVIIAEASTSESPTSSRSGCFSGEARQSYQQQRSQHQQQQQPDIFGGGVHPGQGGHPAGEGGPGGRRATGRGDQRFSDNISSSGGTVFGSAAGDAGGRGGRGGGGGGGIFGRRGGDVGAGGGGGGRGAGGRRGDVCPGGVAAGRGRGGGGGGGSKTTASSTKSATSIARSKGKEKADLSIFTERAVGKGQFESNEEYCDGGGGGGDGSSASYKGSSNSGWCSSSTKTPSSITDITVPIDFETLQATESITLHPPPHPSQVISEPSAKSMLAHNNKAQYDLLAQSVRAATIEEDHDLLLSSYDPPPAATATAAAAVSEFSAGSGMSMTKEQRINDAMTREGRIKSEAARMTLEERRINEICNPMSDQEFMMNYIGEDCNGGGGGGGVVENQIFGEQQHQMPQDHLQGQQPLQLQHQLHGQQHHQLAQAQHGMPNGATAAEGPPPAKRARYMDDDGNAENFYPTTTAANQERSYPQHKFFYSGNNYYLNIRKRMVRGHQVHVIVNNYVYLDRFGVQRNVTFDSPLEAAKRQYEMLGRLIEKAEL